MLLRFLAPMFLATLCIIMMLAACTPAYDEAAGKSLTSKQDAQISFTPSPGPSREADVAALLKDPKLQKQGEAKLVKRYRAASGKTCTLIAFDGDPQNWVGCSSDGSAWQVMLSFLTPDAVFGVAE